MTSGDFKTKVDLLPWVLLLHRDFIHTDIVWNSEMLWTGGGCYERPRAVTRWLMLYLDERSREAPHEFYVI